MSSSARFLTWLIHSVEPRDEREGRRYAARRRRLVQGARLVIAGRQGQQPRAPSSRMWWSRQPQTVVHEPDHDSSLAR